MSTLWEDMHEAEMSNRNPTTDQVADQVRPKDLRDEFAMNALQGLVSDPSSGYQYVSPQSYEDGVAKRAYELADAMIRARGK